MTSPKVKVVISSLRGFFSKLIGNSYHPFAFLGSDECVFMITFELMSNS